MRPAELSTRVDNLMPTIQTSRIVQEIFRNSQVFSQALVKLFALGRCLAIDQKMGIEQPADFVVGGQTFVLDSLLGVKLARRKDSRKGFEKLRVCCEFGS